MEAGDQAGGRNPILVLALHCHNVQKSLAVMQLSSRPSSSSIAAGAVSAAYHEDPHPPSPPLHPLVSALSAMTKGMPPAVLTLFRQPGSGGDKDHNQASSCSCSLAGEPLPVRTSCIATKPLFGLSLPNSGLFNCFDHNERTQAMSPCPSSPCACCDNTNDNNFRDNTVGDTDSSRGSSWKPLFGLWMQGFSIAAGLHQAAAASERESSADYSCSCDNKGGMESRKPILEGGTINVSLMAMSLLRPDNKQQLQQQQQQGSNSNFHQKPGCEHHHMKNCSSAQVLSYLKHNPTLLKEQASASFGFGFLCHHFSSLGSQAVRIHCERKRSRAMSEGDSTREYFQRNAAKRPFLGFSVQLLLDSMSEHTLRPMQIRAKTGKRRILTRLRSLGFARIQVEPEMPSSPGTPSKKARDGVVKYDSTDRFCDATAHTHISRLQSIQVEVVKRLRLTKLRSLGFARMHGDPEVPSSSVSVPDEGQPELTDNSSSGANTTTFQSSGMQAIQVIIPKFDELRSSLRTLSVKELVDRVYQMTRSDPGYPDKKKLTSVQDFFRYTEAEGRRLFEELDRDSDGQVTLDDLEIAMKRRRLPQRYAREFLRRTRKHWFAKSFGWSEFQLLMEQKEPMMLRAFTSLSLSKSGTLQKNQVLASLRNAGLPATDSNAAAMMKFLNVDTDGSIAYGQFRNFMLLLPPERLGDDPRMVWFEAATVVPMAPPVDVPAGSVLKSALAGGLASALSTSLLHPLDTVKTRLQASTLSFPEVIAKLPQIGVRGMYQGSIPAVLGQFTSHGIRTGVLEASKLLLKNMAPNISDIQVQSLSSFTSTVIGTAVRIPCEVLKQRLQAGLYHNVGEAIVATYQQDGLRGFFRGTGVTLCREVPFYVAGMGIYEEAKKVVQQVLDRELAPWETIAIGGLSGGLAAVATTPFDVMKTRTMTAGPGMPSTMGAIMIAIVQQEGLLALFKGALPRFFWIAPLGAMNFAGYELAKRAMEEKNKEVLDFSSHEVQ